MIFETAGQFDNFKLTFFSLSRTMNSGEERSRKTLWQEILFDYATPKTCGSAQNGKNTEYLFNLALSK